MKKRCVQFQDWPASLFALIHGGTQDCVTCTATDRAMGEPRPTCKPDAAVQGKSQLRDLSTSLFALIQGIIARSFSPTCSIW
jgi:hypothetical protein